MNKRLLIVLDLAMYTRLDGEELYKRLGRMGFKMLVLMSRSIGQEDIRLFDLDKLTKTQFAKIQDVVEQVKKRQLESMTYEKV